jgi:NAD(P)-dependent dehydrogenase (short-subunit alcohol dehydrogenase family)
MSNTNWAERPLAGRVALVTGSARNIGKAIALGFAGAGADVVINGREQGAALEAIAAQIRDLGVRCLAVAADVSTPEGVAHLVDRSTEELGRVDVAVSNVGLRLHQPFLEISVEDWHRTLNTSLSSAFYMARAVIPGMMERGFGRLIHISGRDGFFPMANRAHNVTAKAGLHAFAKALALEFGPAGITANTVAPGLIDTERDLNHYPDYAERVRTRVAQMPARRIGQPDDIGRACVYLATAGNFVTGQLLHVNGGEYMY